MRSLPIVLALLGASLAVSSASAAVTVIAQPPLGPIPWDAPTAVMVKVQAPCSQLYQDKAGGATTLEVTVAGGAPPWLTAAGQTVPWDDAQCDKTSAASATGCQPAPNCASDYPRATTYGNVTFTPTADAPALQPVIVGLQARNGDSGMTNITLNIAYHGTLTASSDADTARAGLNQTVPLNLTVAPFTNGKSKLFFTLKDTPASGTLEGLPDTLDVNPPTAYFMNMAGMGNMWMAGGPDAGKPQSISVPLSYHSSSKPWPGDNVTIEVQMKSNDDPTLVTAPVSVHWTLVSTVTKAKASSPGPGFDAVLLASALVAFVVVRRR